jgi:hypothetical protein
VSQLCLNLGETSSPLESLPTAGETMLDSGHPGCGLREDDKDVEADKSWTSSRGGLVAVREVEGDFECP